MSDPEKHLTCAERWPAHLALTIDGLREAIEEDSLYEYGLSFEWKPGEDGEYGYFEWCLSWGGPADYLRFYVNYTPSGYLYCDQVDYSFQDWYDGETRTVYGSDGSFLREVFDRHFADIAEGVEGFDQHV